jgi:hypothetical protein
VTAPQPIEPIVWPPGLADLKRDLKIETDDTRDDERLTDVLAAAVTKVIELRGATVNFTGQPSTLPSPGADLALGAVRLAARWHARRRSPDGLIDAGEMGTARVSSYDSDIERLLKIGRYAGPVFA